MILVVGEIGAYYLIRTLHQDCVIASTTVTTNSPTIGSDFNRIYENPQCCEPFIETVKPEWLKVLEILLPQAAAQLRYVPRQEDYGEFGRLAAAHITRLPRPRQKLSVR